MNIYIGNLARTVSEDKLRALFEQFGMVVSVKVIKDKFTGDPKGFGFVEMATSDETKTAINELNGTEVDGQRIRVNEARPPQPRTQY